ncbi:MAG: hypothetical protein JWR60_2434 [Polaromonas sp.]|nr:hypothetical protein [Polaromonas sp.]
MRDLTSQFNPGLMTAALWGSTRERVCLAVMQALFYYYEASMPGAALPKFGTD